MNTFQNICTVTGSDVEFDGHEAFAKIFLLLRWLWQDPKNIAGRREQSRMLVLF